MGVLLQLPSPEDRRKSASRGVTTTGTISQSIIKNTLPIDLERIHQPQHLFLKLLLEFKEVHIVLSEEEMSEGTTLRILGEDDESWDMSVGEFVSIMTVKPSSTTHADLKSYILKILGSVGVKVIFDLYSPEITRTMKISVNKENLRKLLNAPVVSEINKKVCHFSIGMDFCNRGIGAYPESFQKPKETSLFSLGIKYLIETSRDRDTIYQGDDIVEIYRYHNDLMYIIAISYGELEAQVMNGIYSHSPQYKSMNNDRIALGVFYNKHIVPLLRK